MPEQTNPSKNEGFLLKANGSRIQFAHCPIRACNGFPGAVATTDFRSILLAELTDWRSAPNGTRTVHA